MIPIRNPKAVYPLVSHVILLLTILISIILSWSLTPIDATLWSSSNKKTTSKDSLLNDERYNIDGIDGAQLYEVEYKELNDQLVARVNPPSMDLGPNVDMAAYLYDHPSKMKPSDFISRNPKFLLALKLFQSLRTVNPTTTNQMCNLHSARVLNNNYLAVNGRPEWGQEGFYAGRRVNKIIERLGRFHAKFCADKYFAKFDELLKSDSKNQGLLDETKTGSKGLISLINRMIGKLIVNRKNESKRSMTWSDAMELYVFSKSNQFMLINIRRQPQLMIDLLVELAAKKDPNLKYLTLDSSTETETDEVPGERIKLLVDSYLVEPCKVYLDLLADVFEPAEFDAKFPIEIDTVRLDYYQAWARYRYCKTVTSFRDDIINDIVSHSKSDQNHLELDLK